MEFEVTKGPKGDQAQNVTLNGVILGLTRQQIPSTGAARWMLSN